MQKRFVARVGQGLEKRHQRVDALIVERRAGLELGAREVLRHFGRIEGRAGLGVDVPLGAPGVVAVVEQDDRAQIGKDAVVHVGAGDGDIAQRRHLDLACLGGVGDGRVFQQATVHPVGRRAIRRAHRAVRRHADVMELIVGKGLFFCPRSAAQLMAKVAIGKLVREEQQPAKLLLIGQFRLAAQEAVVFRVEGREGVACLIGRDRLGHGVEGGRVIRTGAQRGERRHIARVFAQPRGNRGDIGHPHLDRVQRRPLRLFGQGGGAAVVELPALPLAIGGAAEGRGKARIACRRRVAVAQACAIIAKTDGAAREGLARVTEPGGRIMAGGTGLGAVLRQVGIEEQRLAPGLERGIGALPGAQRRRRQRGERHRDQHSPFHRHLQNDGDAITRVFYSSPAFRAAQQKGAAARGPAPFAKLPPGSDPGVDLDNPRHGRLGGHLLALAAAARGQLDQAVRQTARADGDAPGQADQVHGGELGAGTFLAVVVKRVEPLRLQRGIERLAGGVGRHIALLQVDEADVEGRHALGPDDALLVVVRLDQRADQAADADAVAAHLDRHLGAVGGGDSGAHRFGIFRAEVEDLPDLDAAADAAPLFRDLVEERLVMGLVGAGVERGELLADRGDLLAVVVIDGAVAEFQLGHLGVIEDFRLAGLRQHQELMGVVAADRARVGPHRDRGQAHPLVGAQIADHVAVIGMQRVFLRQIEGIAVLHQELAAAHHAEARADLVAELPLDMVERQRQRLVAFDMRTEDVGDHLLVRGPIEHLAVVAVLEAQHLGAVGVIAPRLAPQIGRLQRRHQQRDVPGADLLLVHDLLEPLEHLEAHRQPGIDPRRLLLDHPRAQHVAVRDDLRLGGVFLEDGEEIAGKTHGVSDGLFRVAKWPRGNALAGQVAGPAARAGLHFAGGACRMRAPPALRSRRQNETRALSGPAHRR
ncbi:hypothetical protein SDC9_39458 [bioreactor metagenome]|uniref:Uncharacterized protein n=1 Tax=bioreactor metagenome TaxID=1076179 RepID=A0A644VS22_9ZZZZ